MDQGGGGVGKGMIKCTTFKLTPCCGAGSLTGPDHYWSMARRLGTPAVESSQPRGSDSPETTNQSPSQTLDERGKKAMGTIGRTLDDLVAGRHSVLRVPGAEEWHGTTQ